MKEKPLTECVRCGRQKTTYQFGLCKECLKPSLAKAKDTISQARKKYSGEPFAGHAKDFESPTCFTPPSRSGWTGVFLEDAS